MEELLQELSDLFSYFVDRFSSFFDEFSSFFASLSLSELFELVKSGFSSLFSIIYKFLFVDSRDFIFSVGNNFFGLVYNSINYGNFLSFFVGVVLIVLIFKVVVNIIRG